MILLLINFTALNIQNWGLFNFLLITLIKQLNLIVNHNRCVLILIFIIQKCFPTLLKFLFWIFIQNSNRLLYLNTRIMLVIWFNYQYFSCFLWINAFAAWQFLDISFRLFKTGSNLLILTVHFIGKYGNIAKLLGIGLFEKLLILVSVVHLSDIRWIGFHIIDIRVELRIKLSKKCRILILKLL